MRILKDKAALIATGFMVLLAVAAVFVSIRVTITAVQRQEQEVRKIPPAVNDTVQASIRMVNTGKISEQKLYFNGMEIKEISAFLSEKKDVLVALDDILKYIGSEYKLYASDDVLETQINDKKLVVRLGKDSFLYGGKEIKLPFASVAAKGKVLVPLEMFSYIDGFAQNHMLGSSAAFVNYFGDFRRIQSPRVKLLRLSSGIGGIWDLTGTRSLWDRKEGVSEEEAFEASPGGAAYILKSGGRVYMMNPEINPEPYSINADPQSAWGGDGKNLYWENRKTGELNLYDVEKDLQYTLENFLWRADSLAGYEGFSGNSKKLMDFTEFGSYRRITFKELYTDKSYTMVQKSSRIIAEGNAPLSPDGERMLFTKPDGAYYVANYDGSGAVKLEQGSSASWISNGRIMIENGYERALYDASGKVRTVTGQVWKSLGQASDGTVFFTDGEALYGERGGIEKKIMPLLWPCDAVVAASMEGPYILVSKKENGVYSSNGDILSRIGRYSDLLRVAGPGQQEDYRKSIQVLPEKNGFLLLQKENRLLTLTVMGMDGDINKKAVLDCTVSDLAVLNNIKLKWLEDRSILLYNPQTLWLVDFKDKVQIYKYREKEGCSIEGVIKAL